MRNINVRGLLSVVCVISIMAGFSKVTAGPVQFGDVIQLVNARPGKAETIMFSRLAVDGQYSIVTDDEDDDKKKQQDDRVITETRTDIVREADDLCDCEEEIVTKRGIPKWWLLGLAAIPVAFILIKNKKDTPTPTATVPFQTPTPGITPTPQMTPTPPGMTPTPTPPGMTPTPTPPEPVPEPMTILLFGTGLASIGLAARRRFGKKGEKEGEKDEE